jgi:hypothetical protein
LDLARTLAALADVAPSVPPRLLSYGLELGHRVRRWAGDEPAEVTLWEELLALRRGPGADAFLARPVGRERADDWLLDRAVELTALVDAIRNHRHAHEGQPLNCILRQGRLRTGRVAIDEERVPVVVRLGAWYVLVEVGDEHPRHLRDRIEQAFVARPREIGALRPVRVRAPLLFGLTELPFGEAVHAHRIGVEGPWMSATRTVSVQTTALLAAHHLVLEGPGLLAVAADHRRRVRALRVALGLDGLDQDDSWDPEADFGAFDAAPFPELGVAWDEESARAFMPVDAAPDYDVARRARFALTPGAEARPERIPEGLPPALRELAARGPRARFGERQVPGRHLGPPSVRYATVHRGAFSFPAFCYAYCRAQHEALALHHPRYDGRGFTFVVPHRTGAAARRGRRGQPVLCSFRARQGEPERPAAFRARLERQLADAETGDDLLSRVLDDVLRAAVPDALKGAAVAVFERLPSDGGSFLGGRGLVARMTVDDEFVDPVARYAGLFEGHFGGSCQERGGICLTAVDRGYRRDLCAVGTGVFRRRDAMDLFWSRLARFLADAAV